MMKGVPTAQHPYLLTNRLHLHVKVEGTLEMKYLLPVFMTRITLSQT